MPDAEAETMTDDTSHDTHHPHVPVLSRLAPRDWHRDQQSTLTFGERAADAVRNGMGSWIFVGVFVAFMIVWALLNAFGSGWDPYPFILLNLFLSMLAGLQGAILLIAAKRQDAVAAALSQHDYDTDRASHEDISALLALANAQLRHLDELHERVDALEVRVDRAHPEDAPVSGAATDGAPRARDEKG